jgi:hypothetical protein
LKYIVYAKVIISDTMLPLTPTSGGIFDLTLIPEERGNGEGGNQMEW